MKKIFFAMLFIGCTSSVQAQYYQREYNIVGQDQLTCGVATLATSSPFIMAGMGNSTIPTAFSFMSLVRVNGAGIPTGTGAYTSRYQFNFNNLNNIRPFPKSIVQVSSGLVPNAPLTVVTGDYLNQTGIFYSTFSSTGASLSAKNFAPGFATSTFEARASCTGNSNTTAQFVYITGPVDISTISTKADICTYIMCIDVTNNTVAWSNIYNLSTSHTDETEIPTCIIPSRNISNELIVAGNITTAALGSRGFVMRINQTTGALIANPNIITFNKPTNITSIVNEHAAGASLGYILCGNVETSPGNLDAWAGKINMISGTMIWGIRYDNVIGGDNTGNSILAAPNKERYFITGTATFGVAGHDFDMSVIEIDGKGAPIQQNTYGSGKDEFGVCSVANLTNGYFTMGNRIDATGFSNFYGVSSYFNGISGCNERFDNIPGNVEVPTYSTSNCSVIAMSPTSQTITVTRLVAGTTFTDCNAVSLPNGDNTNFRIGNEESENNSSEMTIAPNPIALGASFDLHLNLGYDASVETEIFDMTGRKVYAQHFEVMTGENSFTIPPDALPAGMYMVLVREGENIHQQRILIH